MSSPPSPTISSLQLALVQSSAAAAAAAVAANSRTMIAMAPSSLKFGGEKEGWSRFKRAFLAWCAAQRLEKFLLEPLPPRAENAGATAPLVAGGSSPSVKKEQLDRAADEAASEQWHQRAASVYASLILALTGPHMEALIEVSAQSDAHSLWKSLTTKYESRTIANQSQLWQQLTSFKQAPGEKVGTCALRLQGVVNLLRAQKAAVDPSLVRHTLLSGVLPVFSNFTDGLRTNKDKTFDELIVDLEEYEECLHQKQAQEEQLQQAHFFRHTQQKGGGTQSGGQHHHKRSQQQQSGGRPKGPCFTCDQMGHVSFDCPKLPQDTKKCTKCRRLGHVDRQCQRQPRRDHQQLQLQPQNSSSSAGGAAGPQSAHRADAEYEYNDEDVMYGAMEEQRAMSAQIRARYATQAAAGDVVNIAWLDSAASLNTWGDRPLLTHVQTVSPPTRICLADSGVMEVHERGQLTVSIGSAGGPSLTLSNVASDAR
jgi:hypothetical protein